VRVALVRDEKRTVDLLRDADLMRKTKRNISIAVLLAVVAVFAGFALASYDESDWGEFWNVVNLCGPIGALLAGSLRYMFGPVLSWIIPVFLLYWSILFAMGRPLRREGRRLTSAFILLWAVFSLVRIGGRSGAGGALSRVTIELLELVSGRIGSILILVAVLVLTSVILFFGSIRSFVTRLAKIKIPGLLSVFKRRRRERTSIEIEERRPIRARAEAADEHARGEPPVKITIARPKKPKPTPKRPAVQPTDPSRSAMNAPLPDISLLDKYDDTKVTFSKDELLARSDIIRRKLQDYGLDGTVKKVRPGPVVTTFEFVPAPGVKVSQIANRADDISLALAARAIRIQAPIPGKGAVGIEVPNPEPQLVDLREMMEHYPAGKEGLWVAIGKTVTGEPFFADLADMPHLLIAGATGSGKSVCINSIICSLLMHHTPATCRFVMVDPKRLELITYNGIPHLLHPVITEAKQVLKVLEWMTLEMDRRYRLLAAVGVKNIQGFNRKVDTEKVVHPETGMQLDKLPYYVTIIDELADIMVVMGNEIYPPITRLSQMARAVGIHLVFATQRPSVDVVTGLIKANFPCRIAFQVTSKTDSRTILDINGGEKLLGNGDMLYLPKNLPSPIRIQGAFISEAEAERMTSYWRKYGAEMDTIDLEEQAAQLGDEDAAIDDELFNKAKELVIMHQQGSISLLQRRLRVGYARAARLIDMLEQVGVVGPFEGSKARRVLVRREDYEGY
jgi:S-DNA-T family DNA segregation ATPase FtsK/SpoIIIE